MQPKPENDMPIRIWTRTLPMFAVGAMLASAQTTVNAAGADGIKYLVAVTQVKASEASKDALAAAERQRKIIAERRAKGQDVKLDEQQLQALNSNATKIKDLEKRLQEIEAASKKGCS